MYILIILISFKQYVDDIFRLFQILQFEKYLNSRHEENSQLSFLGVLTNRHAGKFFTSLYKKKLLILFYLYS